MVQMSLFEVFSTSNIYFLTTPSPYCRFIPSGQKKWPRKNALKRWKIKILRQCSGQNSIFCNNRTSDLIYGWKHCWYDVNTKMPQFYIFRIRLLWKPGKIAAMLDSQESKKRSQFWKFFNQILYLNWK